MAKNNSNLHGAKKAKNDEFKKMVVLTLLATLLVNVNAHNVHYPTYTIDDITYVTAGVSDAHINGVAYKQWSIAKVDKPNERTITIPFMIDINGETGVVRDIRKNALAPCVSLDSLIISDGMYLHEETFKGCRKLEYLYYSSNTGAWGSKNKYSWYPELSVKTLETTMGVAESAFWKSVDETLETLIIRDNSTFICSWISDCKKLKTIISYAVNPPKSISANDVYSYGGGCGKNKFTSEQWPTITLYVPRESLEKYYFHEVWGEIDNIYAIDEMEVIEKKNNTTTNIIFIQDDISDNWYSVDGKKVDKPTKGIYVKNGQKYVIK